RALRQLCARYHLEPVPAIGGYCLNPARAPGAPAPPPAPVGLFEKPGVRMFARSIAIYQNVSRQMQFPLGVADLQGNSSMSLSVEGLWPEGDGEAVAGVENVTAMDDLGNLLQSNPRNGGFGLFFHSSGTFPDEWTAEISFPGPHSRARKLRWVEGDL